MENLLCLGQAVGEYRGNGQGEEEEPSNLPDAEPIIDEQEENEDSGDNTHPLYFFFDCETTGLSIYNDHMTELAAKTIGVPNSSVSQPTFSSLIHTSRNISKPGTP